MLTKESGETEKKVPASDKDTICVSKERVSCGKGTENENSAQNGTYPVNAKFGEKKPCRS